jgi:hypothetical protein
MDQGTTNNPRYRGILLGTPTDRATHVVNMIRLKPQFYDVLYEVH